MGDRTGQGGQKKAASPSGRPRRLRVFLLWLVFLFVAVGCSLLAITFFTDGGNAPPQTPEQVVYVGTASSDVIVVIVETEDPEPDPALWKIDGIAPSAVGLWSYPWHEGLASDGYPITMRHRIYLELSDPLVDGQSYSIATPYGTQVLTFDERKSLCESIHVNQVGYFGGSSVRYANLGVYLGNLGPRLVTLPLAYDVIEDATGSVVHSGLVTYWGDDTGINKASGEHVYRIDLAAVPSGGPYHISLAGFGRSHSFGVGARWSSQLLYVATRGLYHQRCGIALDQPSTPFTRGICHTTVQVTDAEPPDFINQSGPVRSIKGGYHDAADFDRRLSHTLIPAWMLNTYDAFPDRFVDNQLNLPESGNGIPDFLDEALWGVLLWEELQEADGGVRAGTETNAHPTYGVVSAATDGLVYRTYRRDGHTTASAAGLFAHASRLVQPFDATRAAALLVKAKAAWQWVVDNNPASAHTAQKMYATLQLYLATEDAAYHTQFLSYLDQLPGGWPEQYNPVWFNLNTIWDGMIFSPYFFAYTITNLPVESTAVAKLTGWLNVQAQNVLNNLTNSPYPIGPVTQFGWGNVTNQGRYADPVMMMYRLTSDPVYLDAVSQLADYSMGLNPIGKSYTTGLGVDSPNNPLHLDSYYTEEQGLGSVPGIVIYGPIESPSGASYQTLVWNRVSPAWQSLPHQRRYCEGWSFVGVQEFTTWETMAQNACMYAFLGPSR